jgi:hypothetical protein
MRRNADQLSAAVLSTVLSGLILGLCAPAWADWEDDPTGKRFYLAGGAFFPRLDTVIRVDAADGTLGTTIDFESTLGMDRSDALPIVRGHYRFNKRHRLNFGYFDLERSGLSASEVEIRFGDVTFPANLPVSSFFDVKVYDLSYGYTLTHSDKWDVDISVGLSLQEISIGIQGNILGVLKEETDVTAPLPTFGASGTYALSEKLLLSGRAGFFAIDLDLDSSNFSGQIIDLSLMLFHQTFEHVGFGVGYVFFDIDVDYDDDSLDISANYQYRGPMALVGVYF